MKGRVQSALSLLVVSAMAGMTTGCTSLHRNVPAPPAARPQPPELTSSPLYTPEMGQTGPRTPGLPPPFLRQVVKEPEPAPKKPKKPRHVKTPIAVAKNIEPESSIPSAPSSPGPAVNSGAGGSVSPENKTDPKGGETKSAEPKSSEVKSADSEVAATGPPTATPIGDLTAGDIGQTALTSRQAADLIKTTRDGADGIKRALSSEEKKTVAEIQTFLKRAEQALKAGDAEGAIGLATKAKLLLDELTQR